MDQIEATIAAMKEALGGAMFNLSTENQIKARALEISKGIKTAHGPTVQPETDKNVPINNASFAKEKESYGQGLPTHK